MEMHTGKYVGWQDSLKGKTALIRTDPNSPDCWLAQFDEVGLCDGNGAPVHSGWTAFSKSDFEIFE